MRLVSLLPSATEIVYALGLGDDLVGVTFECDEPPRAPVDKTVVVGGRDTRGMSPGEIDEYVEAQLAAGGDLYTLHADALAGLDPDLILTQDLCRVCALPSGHVADAAGLPGLPGRRAVARPVHARRRAGHDPRGRGARPACPERAAALVDGAARPAGRGRRGRSRAGPGRGSRSSSGSTRRSPPGTGCPTWSTAAGGEPVAARRGPRSVADDLGGADRRRPRGRARHPVRLPPRRRRRRRPRAVAPHFPDAQVWAIDADGLVVRPGPRLVDGVEAIAAILHPGAVPRRPPKRLFTIEGVVAA